MLSDPVLLSTLSCLEPASASLAGKWHLTTGQMFFKDMLHRIRFGPSVGTFQALVESPILLDCLLSHAIINLRLCHLTVSEDERGKSYRYIYGNKKTCTTQRY